MQIQAYQVAALAARLPRYSVASISGTPYIGTDAWPGDTLDITPATVTAGFPIPSPLSTLSLAIAGIGKGDPATYTLLTGDVGQSTQVTQASTNTLGTVSASSNTITPVVVQRAWDQGLVGGNTAFPIHYSVTQYLNNGGQGVRQPFFAFNSTSTTYGGTLDGNGWPTSSFSVMLSATIGGLDGQLKAGTYKCAYRSVSQASTVTVLQSCTVSNISNTNPNTGINDGVTTYFTLVIPFAQNPMLSFSGGIQYLDIPRDGVTYTYGGPEFWPVNLAHFGQFSVARHMDLCQANIAEKVWSDRNTARPEYGPTQPGNSYSWERLARYFKAQAQYAGSRSILAWINPPGTLDPTATQSNNYAYQLPTLLNTILAGVSLQLAVELGDEPWNASLGGGALFSANLHAAETETQCLPWYLGETSNISSIVGNGDGTVTVTTSSPLSAIPLPDGSTFAITNGMQVVVNHQQANSTWGAGSITPDPNSTVDGTIVSVPVTVLSSNSFKYTSNGTTSATLGAPSGGNQMAFFFNLASNLIKDGNSLNIFDLGNKVHIRRTFLTQQIWSAVRPQDKFILNLQQYGSTATGAMTNSKFAFPYARYLGAGSDAWYWGPAVAPYVKPSGLPYTGTAASGGTTVTGVPWASTAIVGDQISVLGAGVAGAALATTVAAGSSGTTLNIVDTISTTVNAGTINYVYGPSASVTASIDGTSGIMTVTGGSGLMVGMMANGTPATLAFGTRITSQIDATHWQLNIPQAVSSTTITFAQTDGLVNAMLSAVPSFALTLASHIYSCMRWGKRPLVYEGGPDTQSFPNQQVAIHTNPAMQTVVSTLLDAWFNQGGKEFAFFSVNPAVFSNSLEGFWSALQAYTDTASPKIAAITGFATRPLAYADAYEPGLVFGPSGGPGTYVEGISQLRLGWQGFYVNGMVACAGSTTHRSLEVLRNLPRGRRYALKVTGSDSAAGTLADIYIDGTLAGTVTMAHNGNATSAGTTPGDSTLLQLGELARGAHRIMVDFPAGRGANVGIFSITLVKY